MKYIEGDLIDSALKSEFDVIVHGVNCQCIQGAGIAKKMVEVFKTNEFPLENENILDHKGKPIYKGNINKLGQIDYKNLELLNSHKNLVIVNAYTQFNYGKKGQYLDYEALTLCMRKINHIFAGKHIGMPKIGCGLAGGDWDKVKLIIRKELKDCDITIVEYNKN